MNEGAAPKEEEEEEDDDDDKQQYFKVWMKTCRAVKSYRLAKEGYYSH